MTIVTILLLHNILRYYAALYMSYRVHEKQKEIKGSNYRKKNVLIALDNMYKVKIWKKVEKKKNHLLVQILIAKMRTGSEYYIDYTNPKVFVLIAVSNLVFKIALLE